MRCRECSHAMKRALEDYRYTESGLENVVLEKAPVYVCPDHGVQAVTLQNVQGIHEAIAAALLKLKRPLRGVEMRFLRKHRAWSQAGLACRLGVTEVTVSRWETEAPPIGIANEQRLRLLFVNPEAFAALQVAKTRRSKVAPPLRIPLARLGRPAPSRISA